MTEQEPEDLGVRIGTKEQKIWEDMKKATLANIENDEKILVIDHAMLKLCDEKIEEQKRTFINSESDGVE